MNARVWTSWGMALFWLLVAVGLAFYFPHLRQPRSDDPRAWMFWLAAILLVGWNLLRGYLVWKPRHGP